MNVVNQELDSIEHERLHLFMFSKSLIGIDVNIFGEPVFVCKIPLHVIKTQSENPNFKIYGYHIDGNILALMIKVWDLKEAPFLIISHLSMPAVDFIHSKINLVTFINEANEPILSVRIATPFIFDDFSMDISDDYKHPNELIDLPKKPSVKCFLISESEKVFKTKTLVYRDTDQTKNIGFNLAEDISSSGEDAVFGHGKRFEDIVHYFSLTLTEANCFFGLKYAMTPSKTMTPSEELCDELIIIGDTALFVQEKSIITKKRFRNDATIFDRINTTNKRIKEAAGQLSKHIKSVKKQDFRISTNLGPLTIPRTLRGLIVVSETFKHPLFFNGFDEILKSNDLFKEIKLNILSLEDYAWLIVNSEGDSESFLNLLDDMHEENLLQNKIGTIPCCFSVSCRIGKPDK